VYKDVNNSLSPIVFVLKKICDRKHLEKRQYLSQNKNVYVNGMNHYDELL